MQEELKSPDAPKVAARDKTSGRRVAGQDPAKRQQILDGAKRCFLAEGFEAASMNDITAEAGVSKGTLYVYFADKEDLFAQLIDREKSALFVSAQAELEAEDVAAALKGFGMRLARKMLSDEVIRAQRMVIGVVDRMPGLARRFYGPDPFSTVAILMEYFARQSEAGVLEIADHELAARQFHELTTAPMFKRRLFGTLETAPTEAELDRMVSSAVEVFLCAYGPKERPGA